MTVQLDLDRNQARPPRWFFPLAVSATVALAFAAGIVAAWQLLVL